MANLFKRLAVLLACIMTLAGVKSHAQSWTWAKTVCGQDAWISHKDNGQYIYVSGIWQSATITVGSTTYHNYHVGPNNYETVIAKYDMYGNIRWSCASVIGQAWPIGITTDPTGSMYFYGCFWTDTVKIGSAVLVNPLLDSCLYPCIYGGGCYFIIKFDSSGNVIWSRTGDNLQSYEGGITIDNASNLYITGTYWNAEMHIGSDTLYNSSYKKGEIFLAKYDSSGNSLWAKSFGGNLQDDASGILQSNGFIYLTGGFISPAINFGGSTVYYSASEPYNVSFLAKFDTAGNNLWAKSSVGSCVPAAIERDKIGNIFIGGLIYDTSFVSFGNDTLRGATLEYSGFLTKYDPIGNCLWTKAISNKTSSLTSTGYVGDGLYGITTDPCNNVWISGRISGDTGGIMIDSAITLHAPAGSYDPMYFAGYDSSGILLQYFACKTGGDDYSNLASDTAGNIYVFADAWVTAIFGGDTIRPSGGETMFLAKYNPRLGCHASTDALSQADVVHSRFFTIQPNPVRTALTIFSNDKITSASIFDIIGRTVYSNTFNSGNIEIDVTNLTPGTYLLKINDLTIKKFLKM
jgi:hypothetical protein